MSYRTMPCHTNGGFTRFTTLYSTPVSCDQHGAFDMLTNATFSLQLPGSEAANVIGVSTTRVLSLNPKRKKNKNHAINTSKRKPVSCGRHGRFDIYIRSEGSINPPRDCCWSSLLELSQIRCFQALLFCTWPGGVGGGFQKHCQHSGLEHSSDVP